MTLSSLLTRLGMTCPIIQAPMAGVATPALAAAVSNAGGLGSLGLGASSVAQARTMIEQTQALTTAPFNVNLFCHAPAVQNEQVSQAWLNHLRPLFDEVGGSVPEQLDEIYTSFVANPEMEALLLELKPAVVSFHFGLPSSECITRLKEAGIVLLATATNIAEAQCIQQAGLDGIVAQGIEAGGHRGMFDEQAADEALSTLALVRLIKETVDLPIIAAGGIMDGADIAQMLDAGASAAQLGTAFVVCPESSADRFYREALFSERAQNTTLTRSISGRAARGLVNALTQHCDAPNSPTPAAYPFAYDGAKQLHALALQQGSDRFAAQWAGINAVKVRALPATELVRTLMNELSQV